MFKVNNKDSRTMPLASFWCLYCSLWIYFTLCSSVSILSFEHVIVGWVLMTWMCWKATIKYYDVSKWSHSNDLIVKFNNINPNEFGIINVILSMFLPSATTNGWWKTVKEYLICISIYVFTAKKTNCFWFWNSFFFYFEIFAVGHQTTKFKDFLKRQGPITWEKSVYFQSIPKIRPFFPLALQNKEFLHK